MVFGGKDKIIKLYKTNTSNGYSKPKRAKNLNSGEKKPRKLKKQNEVIKSRIIRDIKTLFWASRRLFETSNSR